MTQQNVYSIVNDLLSKSVDLFEGEELTGKEWKAYYRFNVFLHYYPDLQPKQVGKQEAQFIRDLHEQHSYSMEDLAWIFRRSKSTIHAVLNGKHKRKRTN